MGNMRGLNRTAGFVALWIVATAAGSSIAPIGEQALRLAMEGIAWNPSDAVLFGALLGLLTGIGQWLVLRARLSRSAWWVGSSLIAGLLIGIVAVGVGDRAGSWAAFGAYGAILGALQRPVLRGRVSGSWAWILASGFAWSLGSQSITWVDGMATGSWWPFGELFTVVTMYAMLGVLAGALTGIVLVWLIRGVDGILQPSTHRTLA